MDKKTLYTLGLKFKRHNLIFEYDENSKSLIIGKNKNTKQQIVLGILIVIVSLLTVGFLNHFKITPSILSKLLFIVGGGFGFALIGKGIKLSKNNSYQKTFKKDSVILQSKKETIEYNQDQFKNLGYEINSYKDQISGKLFLNLNNESKVDILTLIEKDRKHLKSDFEYLIEVLNNILNK